MWRRDADVDDEVFTAVLRASARRNRYVQRLALEAMASAPGKFSVPEDRLVFAIRGSDTATRGAAVAAVSSGEGDAADDVLDELRRVYAIDVPPRATPMTMMQRSPVGFGGAKSCAQAGVECSFNGSLTVIPSAASPAHPDCRVLAQGKRNAIGSLPNLSVDRR